MCSRLDCRRRIKGRLPQVQCEWCGTVRRPGALAGGDCAVPMKAELSCVEQRARVLAAFPHLDFSRAGDLIFGL